MWSDKSKVIQNNKLDFLHIGRVQQKAATTFYYHIWFLDLNLPLQVIIRWKKVFMGRMTKNGGWGTFPERLYLLNSFFCMAVFCITFGVLSKVSLKVKLKFFKTQNIFLPSICRDE